MEVIFYMHENFQFTITLQRQPEEVRPYSKAELRGKIEKEGRKENAAF